MGAKVQKVAVSYNFFANYFIKKDINNKIK